MTLLEFDFPIWFKATPLKHKNPKMVRGIFRETFEVAEIESDTVHPAMSLVIGGVNEEYVEIGGGFYRSLGDARSDRVLDMFSGPGSVIPDVASEYFEFRTLVARKARDADLAIFPKQAADESDSFPALHRDWFSDTDLQWLDKRLAKAHYYLSRLKSAEGRIYEPMPEPMFVVNMSVSPDGTVGGILMDFRSSKSAPLYSGWPVAFFRADQQEEALGYVEALAARHSVPREAFQARQIEIYDGAALAFNPYTLQVLEAAAMVMNVKGRRADGYRELTDEIATLLGGSGNEWRRVEQASYSDATLIRLEEITRQASTIDSDAFPTVVLDTLLERWDERPISPMSPAKAIQAAWKP
jgi:hypothetical protein